MWINQHGTTVLANEPYTAPDGTQYTNTPKSEIPGLTWVADPAPTPEEIASALASAKAAKNLMINRWRMDANQTSFAHAGKTIACDPLSRSDIDAVAGSISLTGELPAGFPGAWKAVDNSYLMLPDVAAFKAMYASMTLQGTSNFSHSQTLKAALAAATTVEQVNAITW
ncbi:MAG: DUF4376 domain-containing protein [Rhodoferax sp.]